MRLLLRPSLRSAQSSLAATLNGNPSAFRSIGDVVNHFVPPEKLPQTVICNKLPEFATDDDVRELFEDEGFGVYVTSLPSAYFNY